MGFDNSGRDFDPKRQQDVLRQWLRRLREQDNVTVTDIVRAVVKRQPNSGISRATLGRFVESDKPINLHEGTVAHLTDVWDYLYSEQPYRARLAEIVDIDQSSYEQDDVALFRSLSRFLRDGDGFTKSLSRDFLRNRLPGRYVLYRRSVEHLVLDRPTGPNDLIRASQLDIAWSGDCLRATESQDFKAMGDYSALRHTNSGVAVAHGKFVIAVMRAAESLSLKVLIINRFEPFNAAGTLDRLYGKMLVASELALFPSAICICRRIPDHTRGQHGLYEPHEVDEVVRSHLNTPTFPNGNVVP